MAGRQCKSGHLTAGGAIRRACLAEHAISGAEVTQHHQCRGVSRARKPVSQPRNGSSAKLKCERARRRGMGREQWRCYAKSHGGVSAVFYIREPRDFKESWPCKTYLWPLKPTGASMTAPKRVYDHRVQRGNHLRQPLRITPD